MKEITLEELLVAGCHFGHQQIRFNPKARDFVFEARDNIHIIDLAKTKEGLEEAGAFVKDLASRGGTLLIVGTKRQAQPILLKEIERVKNLYKDRPQAQRDNLFYITSKWIGGILTNFSEISKNLKKLKDLKDKLQNEEEKAQFTKKEIGLWDKERQRLEMLYGGISDIQKAPDALFIIDSHLEDLAVREANNMHVTSVAIVDTNADPTVIDYVIPANDDAVGSIELITSYIINSWIEGLEARDKTQAKAKADLEKEEAKEKKALEKAEAPKVKKVEKKPAKKAKSATAETPRAKKKKAK